MRSCTIVIPVYNCEENLLRRSIDSLKKLREEIEVVLVDDGSTNGCDKILDEYAQCAERFCVIHQKNTGVSSARNAGIRKATGKYICFCDADDVIDPNALDVIVSRVKDTEVGFVYSDFNKNIKDKNEIICLENIGKRQDMLKKILCEPNRYGAVWGNLYRRQIIMDNELFFNEELSHAEDTEFLIRFVKCADTIEHTENRFYTYYIYENSAAKINRSALDNFCQSLEVIRKDISEYPELKGCFGSCCNINLLIMMVNYIFREGNSYSEGSRVLKQLLKKDIFRQSLSDYDEQSMGKANKAVLTMLKAGQLYPAYMAVRVKQHIK